MAALDPERSLTTDLGVRYFGNRLYLAAYAYRNTIDDYIERIDLEPGVVINTPSLEWHVFEWEPGGYIELLFIYGQVDDIRPEDMEKDA